MTPLYPYVAADTREGDADVVMPISHNCHWYLYTIHLAFFAAINTNLIL